MFGDALHLKMHVVKRSIAAVAVTFVATKVTKRAVSRNASLRSWPLPCKTGRTTGCLILPLLCSLKPLVSGKIANALPAAPPIIVLPAFARSCSADGEEMGLSLIPSILES